MDFSTLLETCSKEPETAQVQIDISEFAGEGSTLTLRELDAPSIFRIPSSAAVIQKRHLDWPKDLCESVAMLALAHIAPAAPRETPPARLYEAIAKNRRLLTHILVSYRAAFPDLIPTDKKEDAENFSEATPE